MRGLLGGIATGALVSALGLGTVSVVSAPPVAVGAGSTAQGGAAQEATSMQPTSAPDTLDSRTDGVDPDAQNRAEDSPAGTVSPVGAVSIDKPLAPSLPDETALATDSGTAPQAPDALAGAVPDAAAQFADTDPSQQPQAMSLDGTLGAPAAPQGADVTLELDAPVLPNPQSLPPQTPAPETDLVLSTDPAQPLTTVVEPEVDAAQDAGAQDGFVVDLGASMPEAQAQAPQNTQDDGASGTVENADPQGRAEDEQLATANSAPATPVIPVAPRVQLQGGQNTLLGDRNTGVTVRRPAGEVAPEVAAQPLRALTEYAAPAADAGGAPMLSIVLIDDGSMSAASAALAGLPFAVTIALDPADAGAAARMGTYRAAGYEVAVLAQIPEGALPSDVEQTLGAVFASLPETIALLDTGMGGLQQDADVTAQAMDILAAGGRGFLGAAQGLNMASRAAGQAGVPAAVIYRDMDADGQDARVIRRFVDQAAFQARRESGVVLVGRVRPDTISALILWGAANRDAQVALVPLSAILNAQ